MTASPCCEHGSYAPWIDDVVDVACCLCSGNPCSRGAGMDRELHDRVLDERDRALATRYEQSPDEGPPF